MAMPPQTRLAPPLRWALWGALGGALLSAAQLAGFQGGVDILPGLSPSEQTIYHVNRIGGTMIGGALLGAVAGVIRGVFVK